MPGFCRIEMLGGLKVHVAGRTIDRFQTRKTGALLAYLALYSNRTHSREVLAEILWPDGDPTAARNRLNQAVSSLRRQVHPPGVQPDSVLGSDHYKLWINDVGVKTDVGEFRKLALSAIGSRSRADLTAAVELYRGELLAGYYEDWVVTERLVLGELYLRCVKCLAGELADSGQTDEALGYLAAASAHDPLDSELRELSMHFHMLRSRPCTAAREFEEFERIAGNRGEEISPALFDAYEKAKSACPHLDEGALPEFKTRDSDQRFGIHSVGAKPSPVTIPRYFSQFVGRELELEQITEWAQHSDPGLLTILGTGGCGKTRLAAQSAVTLFRAGCSVYWVGLTSIDSADQIVPEVCRAVCGPGLHSDPAGLLRETLSCRSRPIIFLDNLEHLADKAANSCLELLACLVDGCLIATSRKRVEIEPETVLQVVPLPIPSDEPLADLAKNPSVSLFVARAQRVKPDFQLTERTAPAIADLCRRLEGLPLALELAASWARTLSPSQMLERVSDRMEFLASNRRDISERHRSIRATIDGSVELLSPDGRDLFKRVSVFRGGWSREAAHAIAPQMDVDAAIEQLADCSIAIPVESGNEMRFHMLETLSDYASRRLSPDELAEISELHAHYFLDFVRRSEKLVSGIGARKLDPDYRNAIAALRHFIATDNWPSALELGELLGGYWEFRGRLSEGLDSLLELEQAPVPEHDVRLAQIRVRIAALAWEHGSFDLASTALSSALESLRISGSEDLLANALFQLQKELHRSGKYEECRTVLKEAIIIGEKLDSPYILSTAWRRSGNASIELQEWDRALEEYEMSLGIARHSGQAELIGPVLTNLAYLGCFTGRLDAARAWLDEAESVNLTTGRSDVLLDCRVNRIHLGRLSGDFAYAFQAVGELFTERFEGWTSKWEPFAAIGMMLESAGKEAEAAVLLGYSLHSLEEHYANHEHLMLREIRSHLARCEQQLGSKRYQDRLSLGRTMGFSEARNFAKGLPMTLPLSSERVAAD